MGWADIDTIQVPKPSNSDPSTIQDKFLVQYLGWYACPGDGSPIKPGYHGWLQWFDNRNPDFQDPRFDLMPDLSSYSSSELYPVPGFKTDANQNVSLFSARNSTTVSRHFHWMTEHDVDGAIYRRWVGHLQPRLEWMKKVRDEVLAHVQAAAESEGRVFAVQYDVSNAPEDHIINLIKKDWEDVIQSKYILDSPNYLRENGRPVISLTGFDWDDTGVSPELIHSMVTMLQEVTPGGAYLTIAVPVGWRFLNTPTPEIPDVLLDQFDALMPAVGLDGGDRRRGDVDFLREWIRRGEGKIDYIPTVQPGYSCYNQYQGMSRLNLRKRHGGRFLWEQVHIARTLGVRTIYAETWDDYCYGSALMPAVSHKGLLPTSDHFRLMALDEDGYNLPSDWYMRICGLVAADLHGGQHLPEAFPLERLEAYWAIQLAPAHHSSVALLVELLKEKASLWSRLHAIGIEQGDAQQLADFLGKILDGTEFATNHQLSKQLLSLLARISRSFQVFPASYELRNVDCDLNKPIHEGGFGYVCKATHQGRTVCVKAVRLYERQDSIRHLRALSKELIIWSHLSHPNIVPFYGIWVPDGPVSRVCVVSPWMENGNLSQFLSRFPSTPRLPLLSDVSAGLRFLHNSNVIHADLKACNVLVSKCGRAMIADFGSSHIALTTSTTTTQSSITPHWTAPELLSDDEARPTRASDVWAFGCIIYEVTTGKVPFYDKTPLQVLSALMRGNTTPLRADPQRDTIQIDERLKELMARCWNYNEGQRPTAHGIVQFFAGLGFTDDRPALDMDISALTAAHRASSHVKINYERVFAILTQVGQTTILGEGTEDASDGATRQEEKGDVPRGSDFDETSHTE